MIPFKTILFPTDFSPACVAAAPDIRALAEAHHAQTLLLTAFDFCPALDPEVPRPSVFDNMEEVRVHFNAQLQAFASRYFEGLPVNCQFVEGDAASEILKMAQVRHVDLIAMPTHGCGVFREYLLGSVTSKILHDADCAVWTSVHRKHYVSSGSVKSIVAAVDTNAEARCTISAAVRLAATLGASVRAVHAMQVEFFQNDLYPDLLEELKKECRQFLKKEAAEMKVDLPIDVAFGPPNHVVAQAVERYNASLVLVGRGHLQSAFGRLRTHNYSIIRSSSVPVIRL